MPVLIIVGISAVHGPLGFFKTLGLHGEGSLSKKKLGKSSVFRGYVHFGSAKFCLVTVKLVEAFTF